MTDETLISQEGNRIDRILSKKLATTKTNTLRAGKGKSINKKEKTHSLEWLPEVKLDYFACVLREFACNAFHIFASNPHHLWPAEEYSPSGCTLPGLAGKENGFLQDNLPVICEHYEITCIVWEFLSECGKEDDKSISLALFCPRMPKRGTLEVADLPSNISGTTGGSYACFLQLLPDAQNSFK